MRVLTRNPRRGLQFCHVGLRIGLPPTSSHALARIAIFRIQLPRSSHGIHGVPAVELQDNVCPRTARSLKILRSGKLGLWTTVSCATRTVERTHFIHLICTSLNTSLSIVYIYEPAHHHQFRFQFALSTFGQEHGSEICVLSSIFAWLVMFASVPN